MSNLFAGHRNLIQGFNTFLPPGYKIELPADESMPLVVTHTDAHGVQGHYVVNQMPAAGVPGQVGTLGFAKGVAVAPQAAGSLRVGSPYHRGANRVQTRGAPQRRCTR